MTHRAHKVATCKTATTVEAGDEHYQPAAIALSITNVARMFGVSTLTLWLYELRGLIRRERVGRDRVYSWKECERIALIVKAGDAGFHAAQLRDVIKAMDERAISVDAQRGRQQCLRLIHALKSQQQAVNNALAELNRIDWELCEQHARRIAEQFEKCEK